MQSLPLQGLLPLLPLPLPLRGLLPVQPLPLQGLPPGLSLGLCHPRRRPTAPHSTPLPAAEREGDSGSDGSPASSEGDAPRSSSARAEAELPPRGPHTQLLRRQYWGQLWSGMDPLLLRFPDLQREARFRAWHARSMMKGGGWTGGWAHGGV